jgi:murein DD-endopeptidase MepM/ murein hydrolase activator NlpD
VLFAGTVRERRANEWNQFGNIVVIDHGGQVLSVLGHLREISVRRGQALARGDRVGSVGQTGWTRVPALYFEVRWPWQGATVPVDPALVALALPLEDIDARLDRPDYDLPAGFALVEHLPRR